MNGSRLERLAPLTGVGFVALLVASTLTINNYDFIPPRDEIVAFYTENTGRVYAGGYLGLLAAFLLLWFSGSVRSHLRAREASPGRLSAIAFAGGTAAAALMTLVYATMIAAAARADDAQGIGAEAAAVFFDLQTTLMGVGVPIGFAALIGASAIIGFRTRSLPEWFAGASGVVAIALLTPISYIAIAGAVLWVLVLSIWLYTRTPTPAAESTAEAEMRRAG